MMATPCPRCSTEVPRYVCPECGLDLQIHEELQALREALRQSSVASDRTAAAVPALAQQQPREISQPPPLPAGAPAKRRRRHLSEAAVGQRWFLALGVIIILFGAGFFLKYAFDERWIGPSVQVTLGFVAGLVLLAAGEALRRKQWASVESGLAALGLGLLYLSAYAGSQVYELLPDYMTLLLGLVVAALGIAIANAWNSLMLAALTFIGGYLAPMLLVAERFGHWLFFLYVALLNVASQVLAYQRRWRLLYRLGAVLSWICLAIWAFNHDQRERFAETFAFTQLLFFLYSVAPFARALLRSNEDEFQGFWLSMVTGLLCVWNSSYLLDYQRLPVTLVTAAYAVVAFALALAFWRTQRPGLAVTWLVAEGMVYLLTTWAVLLPDQWITVFWAGQTVALYAVAAQSRDRALVIGSFVVALFVAYRLIFLDTGLWSLVNETNPAPLFHGWLSRWAVSGVVLGGFALIIGWDRSRRVPSTERRVYPWFEALWLTTVFAVANLELDRATREFLPGAAVASFSFLWAVFAAAVLVYGLWEKRKAYRIAAILLLLITTAKVLVLDTAQVSTPYRILSCIILGVILVVLSSLYYRFSDRLLKK
ncbi:MAG TPA: DUF2339 domain-containing protein [Chthoniobacterales bacterium]